MTEVSIRVPSDNRRNKMKLKMSRGSSFLLPLVCFQILLLIKFDNLCICSRTDPAIESAGTDDNQTWRGDVIKKLREHLSNLVGDLQSYLEVRYLPYLRIVGSVLDHKTTDANAGMSKPVKSLLRLSTLHAYFIIHQTALVNSAINLLESYLKTKEKHIKLESAEMNTILLYLTYQIRIYSMEHKSQYFLEFAHLCSENELPSENGLLNDISMFINYLIIKVNLSRTRANEARDKFLILEKTLDINLRRALDFKINDIFVQKHADQFFTDNGLGPIISGYLFMSTDDSFRDKLHRKFKFKRYFDNRYYGDEEEVLREKGQPSDAFDPVMPLDIDNIPLSITIRRTNQIVEELARITVNKQFQEELLEITLPLQANEVSVIQTMIRGLDELEIPKHQKEHDGTNEKAKQTRSMLLNGMNKIAIDYQILKTNILDRFVNLAKSHIGYETDGLESFFIVPFNDHVFALKAQDLLFAFYPVVMSQASNTLSDFSVYNYEANKDLVVQTLNKPLTVETFAVQLERLYGSIKLYKKRESIIAALRAFKFKEEVTRFRNLPPEDQGFYVAFSSYAFGNVLSQFLEPSYNEMHFMYDSIQKRIIETLLSEQRLAELSMTQGKLIESNLELWLSMIDPLRNDNPL